MKLRPTKTFTEATPHGDVNRDEQSDALTALIAGGLSRAAQTFCLDDEVQRRLDGSHLSLGALRIACQRRVWIDLGRGGVICVGHSSAKADGARGGDSDHPLLHHWLVDDHPVLIRRGDV
eukprot:CAMPEP_0181241414 /NCGR_PEP_ID=MMETSP1096-20121128/41107_1 /TAXON_ID=156174 ORGANISM="Chrysochromulina ericina, Strain CCMP281" /NCGR_SAMPLE_ID=MMETSP1096 /ASSEMBLY_ACC=CAM_ASM_000453 /LENGTH=119 /DNA_ID=CAMNT_0023337481 /DNA_START=315 /DNA_END=675 /DNA_ORIENTATION=+